MHVVRLFIGSTEEEVARRQSMVDPIYKTKKTLSRTPFFTA
jgi:hypothetical protein